jgi:hypothetical protein
MTLTVDTEDEETNERQVLKQDGETPKRGRRWRGSKHRQAEDDATPSAQATSPKRYKKLKDRQAREQSPGTHKN